MSRNGSTHSAGVGGSDFHLPDEILAVIPTEPYGQLDLARKITSMAIASRVSKLEAETGCMRQKIYEQDQIIYELEEKASNMQRSFLEAESRLKISLDENERDSLAMRLKKLSHDLAKLETFKRQLMQSLNDDSLPQAETVDIGTCDQSAPNAYPDKDEEMNGYATQNSFSGSTDTGNTNDDASRHARQRFSITPYITPRLTPTGTPKIISTSVSPKGFSAIGSPQKTSGTTSYERWTTLSSWYPSSQQSSAANSPPHGRPLPGCTPRIDGKEFFRQARSRLSYEQFSAFLANVKELNAQKQTREKTLRKAEEIFGMDNKDLYLLFQGLLNRNIR
ncbi:uncharacterized protein At4g15545-like isoform X2 [Hevea brasiliensis]|uniref:uncharacterized protein At4g15545-like isoform X2 n=1 Tax=Hevea brasiliensis TaxID=3981 RepID=UPI0025DEDA6D|nr:uncharacterized protein At4g15545-like isoform X2 [Hevea brasiliensis]